MKNTPEISADLDWLFFDIGGVLVSNDEFEQRRQNSLLEIIRQFHPSITSDDYQQALVRASSQVGDLSLLIISELLPSPMQVKEAEKMLMDYRKAHQHERYEPEFRKDAIDVISVLSKEFRLGIIANQPREMQQKIELAGLAVFFSHIGISDIHGLHKPDKGLFEVIFFETGANPSRSLMIDDNIERGLLPAHELGMKTCWFKLYEREMPKYIDFSINSLSDLIELLIPLSIKED